MAKALTKPLIFNTFKYVGINSYDVIRHFKRNLPEGYGKIGHFGTLDPFACGVLLIGVGGATRLNEYIHSDLTKTYLGIGKLGVESETGDNTGIEYNHDQSSYLKDKIAHFDSEFIEKTLQEKFVGEYMQSPHSYSASKHEGRPLHQWAREGVTINKAAVARHIYSIEVVRYQFPYLSLRVEVGPGTYVRTLFSDCARYLGTYGLLIGLVREKIGQMGVEHSLRRDFWPQKELPQYPKGLTLDQALPRAKIVLDTESAINYRNGNPWFYSDEDYCEGDKFWVYNQSSELIGLGEADAGAIRTCFNLPQ